MVTFILWKVKMQLKYKWFVKFMKKVLGRSRCVKIDLWSLHWKSFFFFFLILLKGWMDQLKLIKSRHYLRVRIVIQEIIIILKLFNSSLVRLEESPLLWTQFRITKCDLNKYCSQLDQLKAAIYEKWLQGII